jgi:hypothetical protein
VVAHFLPFAFPPELKHCGLEPKKVSLKSEWSLTVRNSVFPLKSTLID